MLDLRSIFCIESMEWAVDRGRNGCESFFGMGERWCVGSSLTTLVRAPLMAGTRPISWPELPEEGQEVPVPIRPRQGAQLMPSLAHTGFRAHPPFKTSSPFQRGRPLP